ncbi:hypothetical protein D3C86_1930870 [compost metagenome]
MKDGDHTNDRSYETKHGGNTSNYTQDTNVFFQFRNFQLTIVFNGGFDVFNRAAYTF